MHLYIEYFFSDRICPATSSDSDPNIEVISVPTGTYFYTIKFNAEKTNFVEALQ
jgi:hypothetical protein